MSFTQEQIDATAKELHRRESAGSAGTGERWEDYRDVARKALEAGHVGVPTMEGAALRAARDTFARWENGDGSEQELAGALHGLIESYSPAPEVEEALELLDTLNESGRMRYDDYVELHGIVSRITPTEPSEAEERMRKSFAAIAHMADWWHGAADKILERLKTETTQDVMLYHDAVSVLVSAHGVFRIAEKITDGAPTEPMNPTDDQVTAAIRIYRNRDPKAFAAEWMPDVLRSVL